MIGGNQKAGFTEAHKKLNKSIGKDVKAALKIGENGTVYGIITDKDCNGVKHVGIQVEHGKITGSRIIENGSEIIKEIKFNEGELPTSKTFDSSNNIISSFTKNEDGTYQLTENGIIRTKLYKNPNTTCVEYYQDGIYAKETSFFNGAPKTRKTTESEIPSIAQCVRDAAVITDSTKITPDDLLNSQTVTYYSGGKIKNAVLKNGANVQYDKEGMATEIQLPKGFTNDFVMNEKLESPVVLNRTSSGYYENDNAKISFNEFGDVNTDNSRQYYSNGVPKKYFGQNMGSDGKPKAISIFTPDRNGKYVDQFGNKMPD